MTFTRQFFYPSSEIFQGFEWTQEAQRYPGSGSDMHWWTWGDDDALYFVDDDGKILETGTTLPTFSGQPEITPTLNWRKLACFQS